MIQLTDQIGLADREAVERAVGHDHGAVNPTRLVGLLSEYADCEVESRIGPDG
jgi:prolyl-tRNA editing enzyme YbaK/EbsC (Cys-tRNA(Pro) deacylase)